MATARSRFRRRWNRPVRARPTLCRARDYTPCIARCPPLRRIWLPGGLKSRLGGRVDFCRAPGGPRQPRGRTSAGVGIAPSARGQRCAVRAITLIASRDIPPNVSSSSANPAQPISERCTTPTLTLRFLLMAATTRASSMCHVCSGGDVVMVQHASSMGHHLLSLQLIRSMSSPRSRVYFQIAFVFFCGLRGQD